MSHAFRRLLSARRAWFFLFLGAAFFETSTYVSDASAPTLSQFPQDGVQGEPSQGKIPWTMVKGEVQSSLPTDATGVVTVVDTKSGASLGFRLEGALSAAASWINDRARYIDALGPGTELELQRSEQGVEDRIRFDQSPTSERVEYLLDLRGVAGVRKVGQVVEFVDEGGAPRLRMEAPYIVSATGENIRASVEVGCEHDKDERGPWGRRPVKGGEECRVSVVWSGKGVVYPAVLDPVWSSAASMYDSRAYLVPQPLLNGRLLVISGRSCSGGICSILSSCEIYDPTTESWAMTGSLSQARDRFSSVLLPDGKVFINGGDLGAESASITEIYDDTTGKWQLTTPMLAPRADSVTLMLPDKKTIATLGGIDLDTKNPLASIELYDIQSNTWNPGGTLNQARFWSRGAVLPDGRILIGGGTNCNNCGPVKLAEIYDATSKTSQSITPMITARFGQGVAEIPIQGTPSVVFIGGGTDKVEAYDPVANKWTALASLSENRAFFSTITRVDNSILVMGGGSLPSFNAIKGVELFDPVSLTWSKAASMNVARTLLGATLFQDGRILAVGGVVGNILSNGNTTNTTEIFLPSAVGNLCQFQGDCISGFCVDGVCCESACQGECMACSAVKKGSGADGVCGPIALDTDPDDECAAQDKSTCGTSGECDGKGACSKYPVNTSCGASACTDGVSTGLLCTANGKCLPQSASCAPFLCADSISCASSCVDDLNCTSPAHCDAQVCKADLVQGAVCSRSAECQSGFCVDGVCCENACEGTCMACSSKLKQEGGADGICAPALINSDPHEDCPAEPKASCDKSGLCDGKGSCALHSAGTLCQLPSCGVDERGVRVDSFACDGSGACQVTSSDSCGLFGCEKGACKASCDQDEDCAPQAYCTGGICSARKATGALCKEARECLKGFCTDGVCCNAACDGQCEACDVSGAAGLCVPVSGAPHGGRAACGDGSVGKPCEQRACDGVERTSCEGYVGSLVSCKEPSCEGGVETPEGRCDGKGACSEPEPLRCEPFVCKGAVCASTCSSDADCTEKFRCDQGKGDCVPRTGAYCADNGTLMNPDGTTMNCAPFACEGSSCKSQCSSVKDCVLPNICDQASRSCIPAQPNLTDSAGCQLTAGAPGSPLITFGWIASLVLMMRRRRAQ